MAKGLVPIARHALKSDQPKSLLERINAKLQRLGMTERKSKELAKAVAPVARNVIKLEASKKAEPKAVKASEVPFGSFLNLRDDLPVASSHGEKGLDLMRIMHGISSSRTYIVSAIKGEEGIIAIRQFYDDSYNVKFYPTMAFWGFTQEDLRPLGAHDYLERQWYQRMHFPKRGVDQLLARVAAQASQKSRVKEWMGRLRAVAITPLTQAFDRLHGRTAHVDENAAASTASI